MADPIDRLRGTGWALVTGASSGIGREYARLLAERGFPCLLVSNEGDKLRDVAAELERDHGVEALAAEVDLADPGFLERLRPALAGRPVAVLVNNAGLGAKGAFTAIDPATYAEIVHVNALAPVLLDRELLPRMSERGHGAVIHVGSINALAPVPKSAVYSASKSFLLDYSAALAHENRDTGLVFQAVLPGTTRTAFHERQETSLPPWAMDAHTVAQRSLRRFGRETVLVPGVLNKVLAAVAAVMPRGARTAAASVVLRKSLGVR